MSSRLSKATDTARKGIIVFLIFAISTFIFRFIFGLTDPDQGIIRPSTTPPSPYVKASQELGKIPRPEITSLPLTADSNPRYSLQNRDTLPDFPPVANIFVINKPREKLGNTTQGREVAEKLEFSGRERIINQNIMFWQTEDTSRSLSYDKLLEIWDYETDLTKENLDEEQKDSLGISTVDGFYDTVGESIINSLGLGSNFFKESNSTVNYVDINRASGEIVSSVPAESAKYVNISQFKKVEAATLNSSYRPQKDEIALQAYISDVRKTDYRNGVFDMILRGEGNELLPDIVNYGYKEFSYGQRGVYNLQTPEEAFIKVQNGEGIIYWLKLKNEDQFSDPIALDVLEFKVEGSRVSLIYIEPDDWKEDQPWTNYLQVYYLFEGTALLKDGREADFAIILESLKDVEYQ